MNILAILAGLADESRILNPDLDNYNPEVEGLTKFLALLNLATLMGLPGCKEVLHNFTNGIVNKQQVFDHYLNICRTENYDLRPLKTLFNNLLDGIEYANELAAEQNEDDEEEDFENPPGVVFREVGDDD